MRHPVFIRKQQKGERLQGKTKQSDHPHPPGDHQLQIRETGTNGLPLATTLGAANYRELITIFSQINFK